MTRLRRALRAYPALALFLAAGVIYNANFRPITTGDTAPAALLPFMVVLHGTVDFDRHAGALAGLYGGKAAFLHEKDGHFYSGYPILLPLLLTPAYLPLRLVPGIREWPLVKLLLLARILEKVWASVIAAASVACLYLILRSVVELKYAFALALIFGFATNTWSTASQALWQHGLCQLTVILSLLFGGRFLERGRWRDCVPTGLFAALSIAARPTSIMFFGCSALVMLISTRSRRKVVVSYGAAGLLCLGALAAYNVFTSGDVLGGYAGVSFGGNFLTGLAGLTVSPSHGLFVYSPVLLFLFAGLTAGLVSRRPGAGTNVDAARALLLVSMGFFFSLLVLYAFYGIWWGGACFGPRFMTDAMPAAVILLVPCLPFLRRCRLAGTVFVFACALSVAIQLVGAFCYPLGEPSGEPLWDWRRNSITSNAAAGIYTKGYSALWDVLRGRPLDLRKHELRVQ